MADGDDHERVGTA